MVFRQVAAMYLKELFSETINEKSLSLENSRLTNGVSWTEKSRGRSSRCCGVSPHVWVGWVGEIRNGLIAAA